uniref:Putative phosphatase YieH n=1 Tax=uncultured bacterium BLR5 TaxID=506522 RepID=C0INU8_9BACT|nr:putative phosphatase YieH [uncultured bacterium BLR5]
MSQLDLVIFDCDGVLVDSELLTNTVFRDMLIDLGATVSLEDMFERFVGHSMAHCLELTRDLLGRDPPDDFVTDYRNRCLQVLKDHLQPVPGIKLALSQIELPMCVASSGDHDKMRTTLGLTGLLDHFEDRLFSVTQVARGKPAPDVFLFAASSMGLSPERAAVVEDTPVGVVAGIAAGMKVFGYAGRTPRQRLLSAGASVVFDDMSILPALLAD